jgi:hypothetical protein
VNVDDVMGDPPRRRPRVPHLPIAVWGPPDDEEGDYTPDMRVRRINERASRNRRPMSDVDRWLAEHGSRMP